MALRFQNTVRPAVSSGDSPRAAAFNDVAGVLAGASQQLGQRVQQQDEILENGEIAKRRTQIAAIAVNLSAQFPGIKDSDSSDYSKAFDKQIASLEAPSSLRVQRETELDRLDIRTRGVAKIDGTIARRQHVEAVDSIKLQLKLDQERAGKISRDFSVDDGRAQELANITSKVRGDLDALLRSGDIIPEEHAQGLRDFALHNLSESTMGDFMRAGFPQETINDIASGKTANELPLDDRDRLVTKLQSLKSKNDSAVLKVERLSRAQQRAIDKEGRALVARMKSLDTPNTADEALAEKMLNDEEGFALSQTVRDSLDTQVAIQDKRHLAIQGGSLADAQELLKEAQSKKAATPKEAAIQDALVDSVNTLRKGLFGADNNSFAQKVGVLPPPEINYTDADTFAQTVAGTKPNVDEASEHFGVRLSVLDKGGRQSFAALLETSEENDQIKILGAASEEFGSQFSEVLGGMAGNNPTLQFAGFTFALGDEDTARVILRAANSVKSSRENKVHIVSPLEEVVAAARDSSGIDDVPGLADGYKNGLIRAAVVLVEDAATSRGGKTTASAVKDAISQVGFDKIVVNRTLIVRPPGTTEDQVVNRVATVTAKELQDIAVAQGFKQGAIGTDIKRFSGDPSMLSSVELTGFQNGISAEFVSQALNDGSLHLVTTEPGEHAVVAGNIPIRLKNSDLFIFPINTETLP